MIAGVGLAPPARAALWMLGAGASYVVSATLTRHLGGAYSVFELAFLRCTIGLVVLLPMMVRMGFANLKTEQFGMHCIRTLLTYAAIVLWFYAASVMPVSDFFALQFTNPLFTIALAVIILREQAGVKSWIATLAGFAGVLIILRPGYIEVSLGALAALATSACYGGVNTTVKILSRRDPASIIVIYVNLLIMPLALVPALFDWRMPSLADTPVIVAIAVTSTVAQLCVARSISGADARVVQPVNFLRLPMAAILGYVLFGELSDRWTWIGALIIFASAWYVVGRESRR